MLVWKCEQCGWQSEKTGSTGSAEAMRHARVGKRQDNKKHSCFLLDTDAQKPVLDSDGKVIKSLAKAQSLGLIGIQGKVEKETKGKKGGDLATVLQPSKGAIIFTLGEHNISLNPQHLYDAYLYYEDIVLRHDIDEDFSLAIKDCVKYVWEKFNKHKAESEGVSITMEEG